jgi:hypothetical protein
VPVGAVGAMLLFEVDATHNWSSLVDFKQKF